MTSHASSAPAASTCPLDQPRPTEARWFLAALALLQMLPATAVAPAIRPLFALNHAGREGGMHAFMGVNMVGAVVLALAVAWLPAIRRRASLWAKVFVVADAAMLFLLTLPLPLPAVLGLRALEGAFHVGATTILMTHAADIARARGDRRYVSSAGAAIVFAIACGSLFGGLLVSFDPRAPFWAGAAMLLGVAAMMHPARFALVDKVKRAGATTSCEPLPRLALAAAFLARFTVGCLVVSFSLFAHRVHGLTDRHVGLLYACLTFAFALSMYPAGVVARHRASAPLLATGMGIYAIALGALSFAPPALFPVLMLAAGVASAFVFSGVLAFAAQGEDGERSRAMAHVNAVGCLGMLLGPAAGGVVSALFRSPVDVGRGYRAALLLGASSLALWLMVFACTALVAWATTRRRVTG